ncbi:MAG: hypothetical protein WBB23_06805 [Desulforhopalus sp.]
MNAPLKKTKVVFFPEETFLEPTVNIDPVEMSNTLIDRIRGTIGIVREGSNADAVFHPPRLAAAMEQVEGNIDMLEKLLAKLQEESEGKVIPLLVV